MEMGGASTRTEVGLGERDGDCEGGLGKESMREASMDVV
jgi:hypothetical protein